MDNVYHDYTKRHLLYSLFFPPALPSVLPEEHSTVQHSKKLGASLYPHPFLVQLFRTATPLLLSNHRAGRSMTLTPRILPSCHSKKGTSFSLKRKSTKIGTREPLAAVPDTFPSLTSQSLTLFQSSEFSSTLVKFTTRFVFVQWSNWCHCQTSWNSTSKLFYLHFSPNVDGRVRFLLFS